MGFRNGAKAERCPSFVACRPQALDIKNPQQLNVIGSFLGDVMLCVKEASKRTR